jgi:alkylated DNA repair protein alkB family protein 6
MASDSPLASLEPHRLGAPAGAAPLRSLFLLPDYVTELQEAHLLSNITAARQAWTQVSGRRLQALGGTVSGKGGLIPAPLPSWLQPLVDRVSNLTEGGLYGKEGPANHVLINSYEVGEGILPHTDGPLYCPVVAIISLGSPAVMRFTRRRGAEAEAEEEGGGKLIASVILPPRSLLVFADDAYEQCLHGIDFAEEETLDSSVVNPEAAAAAGGEGATLPRRGTRVSLTIRRVLKVHRLGVGLLRKR